MVRRRKTEFSAIRDRAFVFAGQVGDAVKGQGLPVPLHELARLRNIQRLRFEPLLSTAGLAKSEDGFEVYLNTEGPNVDQKPGTVLDAGTGNWNNLASPIRFSVAHEIAHLIFKEVGGENSQDDLFRENSDKLEVACNEMARMLLVPKQLLIQELGDQLFDSSHLGKLLSKFRVSAEVFLRRFKLADLKTAFGSFSGLIALAREERGVICIGESHSFGHLAVERFGTALGRSGNSLEGCPIHELGLHSDIEALVRRDATGGKELRVPWRSGKPETLRCELTYRWLRRQTLLMLAIKIIGFPELHR